MHCKTAECYDTIGDRAIITPSFTRNPILFLERISAVLVGLGPGPVIQVASDETRLKSIKLLRNSAQGPGEDSGLKETLLKQIIHESNPRGQPLQIATQFDSH